MKMKLCFLFIVILLPFSWQQMGSLDLTAKLGPEYQLDSSIYASQGSKLIKKISSLVNTPSFIINNQDLPQNGENIKYTETDTHVIYIIVLPSFPSYVKKEDVLVSQSSSGLTIEVKDSNLFANNAFFPDLTSQTSSAVIRGKNYKVEVHFFQKMKAGAKGLIEITDNSEKISFLQKHINLLKKSSFLQIKNGPMNGPIAKSVKNLNLNPIKQLDNRVMDKQPHFLQKNAIIEENYVYHPEPPHSFVVRFTISKRDLEPNIYQNKLNKFYIGSISTIPSAKKLEEINKKFKSDFERDVKINSNGEKVEIFSKHLPESNQGPISKNLEEMIKDINKRLDPNFDRPREKKEWVKKAEEEQLRREREDENEEENEAKEKGEGSSSESQKSDRKASESSSPSSSKSEKNDKKIGNKNNANNNDNNSQRKKTENSDKNKGKADSLGGSKGNEAISGKENKGKGGASGNSKGIGRDGGEEKQKDDKNTNFSLKKEIEGRKGDKEKGKKKNEKEEKSENQKKMDQKEKESNKSAEKTQKEAAAIMEKSLTMVNDFENRLESAEEIVPESSEEEYEYES